MMTWLSFFSSLVLVLLLLITAFYFYSTWRHSELDGFGLPHEKPGFLRGNFPTEGMQDLDVGLRTKLGNIYGFFEGRNPAIVVGDLDLIKNILVRDFSCFTNRRPLFFRGILSHDVFSLRDEAWKSVRSILTPALSSGKIKRMLPNIIHCGNKAISRMQSLAGQEFQVRKFCMNLTMENICRLFFGFQISDKELPRAVEHGLMFVNVSPRNPLILLNIIFPHICPFFDKLFPNLHLFDHAAYNYFLQIVTAGYQERKNNVDFVGTDVLQLLVEAEKQTEKGNLVLTKTETIANSLLLLVAGFDTTSTSLQFFMYEMATNPDHQDKLVEEIEEVVPDMEKFQYEDLQKMKFMDMCIDETMRLYPAAMRVDRLCKEEVNYGKVTIPKGYVVNIPIRGIHRDPEIWPEPDKFDPYRFTAEEKSSRHPCAFLPFGIGPRACPGNRLALVVLKISIIMLFKNFCFKTSPKTQIPPVLLSSFTLIAEDGILLKSESREAK